jgi:hypothetical protein
MAVSGSVCAAGKVQWQTGPFMFHHACPKQQIPRFFRQKGYITSMKSDRFNSFPSFLPAGRTAFLLAFFAAASFARAEGARITGAELGGYFRPEYNRAFYFCEDVSVLAAVEINSRYAARGGIALGNTGSEFAIKAFAGGQIALFAKFPLYLELHYAFDSIPGYETSSHIITPRLSLNGKRAGFSLGTAFRFTRFFDDPAIMEPVLSLSVYVFFYDRGKLRFGMRCANFDDFTAGNLGAYSLSLNSLIRLTGRISLINEICLLQSGSIALASNFYGVAWRGGITFTW